jgi:hypothetical protein
MTLVPGTRLGHIYTYGRTLSDLYLAEGLR